MRRMMMVMGAIAAMATCARADETASAANGVQAKERLEVGGDTNLVTRGGVPGFYYTLFKSAAVTDVLTAAAHDKANSDQLCDGTGSVVFQKVAKPSAAAGFFTTGVSSEPTLPSGVETPVDIRGGGIIVIPPVTTTGSDD